ncbi:hypothetical protein FB107DRAFT_273544 [Schizophyllum commune]
MDSRPSREEQKRTASSAISRLYDDSDGLCNSQVTDSQAIHGLICAESPPSPGVFFGSQLNKEAEEIDGSNELARHPVNRTPQHASEGDFSPDNDFWASSASAIMVADEAGSEGERMGGLIGPPEVVEQSTEAEVDISASGPSASDCPPSTIHCACFHALKRRLSWIAADRRRLCEAIDEQSQDIQSLRNAVTDLQVSLDSVLGHISRLADQLDLEEVEDLDDTEQSQKVIGTHYTPRRKRARTESKELRASLSSPVPEPHIRSWDSQIYSAIVHGYGE